MMNIGGCNFAVHTDLSSLFDTLAGGNAEKNLTIDALPGLCANVLDVGLEC